MHEHRGVMKVCALLVLASACTSPDPWQPDFDNDHVYPGPSRALVQGIEYQFAYDELDRLVSAGFYVRPEHSVSTLEGAEWSYDASGNAASVLQIWPPQITGTAYSSWKLDAEPVERTFAVHSPGAGQTWSTYDPALFAFLPMVGIGFAEPKAELGILSLRKPLEPSLDPVLYTWTIQRNVRTSLSTLGDSATYTLDGRGRLVSIDEDTGTNGSIDRTRTYEYTGDLLVRTTDSKGDGTFEEHAYDRGGNLVQTSGPDGPTAVYIYDGW
jgi:hypothetical protein